MREQEFETKAFFTYWQILIQYWFDTRAIWLSDGLRGVRAVLVVFVGRYMERGRVRLSLPPSGFHHGTISHRRRSRFDCSTIASSRIRRDRYCVTIFLDFLRWKLVPMLSWPSAANDSQIRHQVNMPVSRGSDLKIPSLFAQFTQTQDSVKTPK